MKLKEFYRMNKEKIILTCSALGIGVISLGITLLVYNVDINSNQNNNDDISQKNIVPEINNNYAYNEGLTEAQKTVAENLIAKLDELSAENNQNNVENDIVDEPKTIPEDIVVQNDIQDISEENLETQDEPMQEEIVEVFKNSNNQISFIVPVDGAIGMDFSDENLMYSKTLDEWISHNGIDFIADVGTDVKAGADGVVQNIYEDARYGYTVVIEHNENCISKYSGIQKVDNIEVGQKIKQGDVISKVAEGTGFEKQEGSHLHFEVIENNKNIRPNFM